MGDRLYDFERYSNPIHTIYDCNEEDGGTEGEYEEEEFNDIENEEISEELACPFCPEDFDVLGLCCHIDADHRMEVKAGICPLCAMWVGINMASHVIAQHENVLKALCNKRHWNPCARSTILLFRKELQEKLLRCVKGSSVIDSSSDSAADSSFLSFVNNPQFACRPRTIESASSTEASLSWKSFNDNSLERIQPSLSTDGKNARASCEFLQGLVLSTILDDL